MKKAIAHRHREARKKRKGVSLLLVVFALAIILFGSFGIAAPDYTSGTSCTGTPTDYCRSSNGDPAENALCSPFNQALCEQAIPADSYCTYAVDPVYADPCEVLNPTNFSGCTIPSYGGDSNCRWVEQNPYGFCEWYAPSSCSLFNSLRGQCLTAGCSWNPGGISYCGGDTEGSCGGDNSYDVCLDSVRGATPFCTAYSQTDCGAFSSDQCVEIDASIPGGACDLGIGNQGVCETLTWGSFDPACKWISQNDNCEWGTIPNTCSTFSTSTDCSNNGCNWYANLVCYNDTDEDASGINGYGTRLCVANSCPAGTLNTIENTDCDETNDLISFGFTEACDGLDNNCDGLPGTNEILGVSTGTEICLNGIDEDCDGVADNGCSGPAVPEVYWADDNTGLEIVSGTIVVEEIDLPYPIKLIFNNSGLSAGEAFEIRESDLLGASNFIETNVTSYTAGNLLIIDWAINQTHLDDAGLEPDGIYEFYFIANGNQSQTIDVDYREGVASPAKWTYPDTGNTLPLTLQLTQNQVLVGYTLRAFYENAVGTFDILETRENYNFTDISGPFTPVDIGGQYAYNWTFNCEDLQATGRTNNFDFQFTIDGNTSEKLRLEITDGGLPADCNLATEKLCFGNNVCADYKTQGTCESDLCSVAGQGIVPKEGATASCSWDSAFGCGQNTLFTHEGQNIGSCKFIEDTSADSDQCNDGFLEYSWTAEWTWDPSNTLFEDPENKQSECVAGSAVIACPAQIQLDFFSAKNLFAAVLLIAIIYWVLKKQKPAKKKKPAKKVVKKKTSKKKSKAKKK